VAKKKKMNKDYGYTTRRAREEYELKRKEETKKEKKKQSATLAFGIILIIATFVLALVNLTAPNKILDICSYGTMSIGLFLFYIHFKESNKKFSTVSLVVCIISVAILVLLISNYNSDISTLGGLLSKNK